MQRGRKQEKPKDNGKRYSCYVLCAFLVLMKGKEEGSWLNLLSVCRSVCEKNFNFDIVFTIGKFH